MVTDQLQRPLRDLRISVTDRCNFRCTYCMPESAGPYVFMPRKNYLSFDEIELVVKSSVSLGVKKVRLTGGEPLLRPKLNELVAKLSKIEGVEDIAMTTNGSALSEQIGLLAEAGLHRVTVSLDSLLPELATSISGSQVQPQKVIEGILKARDLGVGVKINTVIMRGVNESQILPLSDFAIREGIPLRFIEYMDVGGTQNWEAGDAVTSDEVAALLSSEFNLESLPAQYEGEVATRWKLKGQAGEEGEVGFISSISKPFCSACNRARLSADGQIFKCLFAKKGIDIKPYLTSRVAMEEGLREIWTRRNNRYSEIREEQANALDDSAESKVPMSFIGG